MVGSRGVGALLLTILVLSGCTLFVSVGDGLTGGAVATDDRQDGGASSNIDGEAPDSTSDTPDTGATDGAITASPYASAVLADRPSLYLRFGAAPGTTSVKNEVAGPFDATYPSGVELGTPGALVGDPDTAITFKGGILELPVGQECEGTNPCAIELFVRIEAIQDGYGWILDHETWDPRSGWLFQTKEGFLTFERWASGTGVGGVYSEVKFTPSVWHHIVSVNDVEGQRMYLDGELRESHSFLNPIPATKAKWTVGGTTCTTCGERNLYKGAIDELAFYDRTLPESRIKAHFAIAKGK